MRRATRYMLKFIDGLDHAFLTPARTIQFFFPLVFTALFSSLTTLFIFGGVSVFLGIVYMTAKYYEEKNKHTFKNDSLVLKELIANLTEIEKINQPDVRDVSEIVKSKTLWMFDKIIKDRLGSKYHIYNDGELDPVTHKLKDNLFESHQLSFKLWDEVTAPPPPGITERVIGVFYAIASTLCSRRAIKEVLWDLLVKLKNGIINIKDVLKTKPALIYLNFFWIAWMGVNILLTHFSNFTTISELAVSIGLPAIAAPYLLFMIPAIAAIPYFVWWAFSGHRLDTTTQKQTQKDKSLLLKYAALEVQNKLFEARLNQKRERILGADFESKAVEINQPPLPGEGKRELAFNEMQVRLQNTYPLSNAALTFIKTLGLAAFGYWITTSLLAYMLAEPAIAVSLASTWFALLIPGVIALVVAGTAYVAARRLGKLWSGGYDQGINDPDLKEAMIPAISLRAEFNHVKDNMLVFIKANDQLSEEIDELRNKIKNENYSDEVKESVAMAYEDYRASLTVYPVALESEGEGKLRMLMNFFGSAESMTFIVRLLAGIICTLAPVLGVATSLSVFFIALALGLLVYAPLDTFIFHKNSHATHDQKFLKNLTLQMEILDQENRMLKQEKKFLFDVVHPPAMLMAALRTQPTDMPAPIKQTSCFEKACEFLPKFSIFGRSHLDRPEGLSAMNDHEPRASVSVSSSLN